MFSTVPPPKRVSRLMHAARYWPSRRTTAVILWHSLLECLMVLVLLFGATTFVRWVVGPRRSPRRSRQSECDCSSSVQPSGCFSSG
jgi:Flp pilus assembly protein TadB